MALMDYKKRQKKKSYMQGTLSFPGIASQEWEIKYILNKML